MSFRAAALATVLIVLAGCSNIETRVDYDENADFSSYETFAWKATPETSVKDKSDELHRHIVGGIQRELQAGGLRKVERDPDLYVTYHAWVRPDPRASMQGFDVGYGSGWRMAVSPEDGSESNAQFYGRGFLTIDILDAKTNTMVWRGSVEKIMTENLEQDLADIDEAIQQLAAQWRKKHKR